MKIQAKIRLLNYLNRSNVINLKDFYCVGIEGYSQVTLQGKFNPIVIKKYSNLFGVKPYIDDNGFVGIISKNFKIILTN